MEMEKGKKLKSVGETQLPDVMIQHIQSFLSGKEAARTTILSKSWYTAWLTRPTLDFDPNDFGKSNEIGFAQYAMKSLQRYQDSNLKIESFRLRMPRYEDHAVEPIAKKLIVKAMKLGATDLNLEFCSNRSILPREVLESETLVRLSVSMRTIDGTVKCRRLKSLVLDRVRMRSGDVFRDIISTCKVLEELSITERNSKVFDVFSGVNNLFELHNLRHLYLERVVLDPSFFTNFASRFPCLKNLSVVCCSGNYSWIQISSTSLERVEIEVPKNGKALALRVELLVPNLVDFRYSSDRDMPSLCIQSSREWESHVTMRPSRPNQPSSLYCRLKCLLRQLKSSKKSVVCMQVGQSRYPGRVDNYEGAIEAVPKPKAVHRVAIDPPFASSYTLVVGLFKICRPTFLTVYWPFRYWNRKDEFIGSILYKRLMKELISPNCGIPDQNIFGKIGLKEVSVRVSQYIPETEEWEALPLNEVQDALTAPRSVEMCFLFKLRWG